MAPLGIGSFVHAVVLAGPISEAFVEHGDFDEPVRDELLRAAKTMPNSPLADAKPAVPDCVPQPGLQLRPERLTAGAVEPQHQFRP